MTKKVIAKKVTKNRPKVVKLFVGLEFGKNGLYNFYIADNMQEITSYNKWDKVIQLNVLVEIKNQIKPTPDKIIDI